VLCLKSFALTSGLRGCAWGAVHDRHLIPKSEFIEVLFRREQGYFVLEKNGERNFHHLGNAPVDFTENELREVCALP
jgi:hypothetical protein